ncbi:T3SS effector HopA1 family protein [Nostoc sp.]|uniref:T3SS effector HopA1 family protein n=1 Tax=Nostoc sp. TaxID=1180 RepID=UPI003594323F
MQLLKILQHIASNLKITASDLHLTYANFPTIEIPTATLAQLQKMPQQIQYKCLNLQMLRLIYSIYCEGSPVTEVSEEFQMNDLILKKIASVEVDWEFYEQLESNNIGKGWFHPDYRVLREEADGSLAVQYDGVIIHIQRNHHLPLTNQSAMVGDLVSIWSPSSYLQQDFYLVMGDASGDFGHPANFSNQAVLVYFNFSHEAAIAAMKCVTTRLNAMNVPFTFKVLYNPLKYKRYDSGILRFDNVEYKLVWEVLKTIYTENKSHFQPQTPLFTKVLAPGIGLAEHPDRQFRYQESFGINRCQIVANALLEAHTNGDESPESRMKYILKYLDKFRIDIEHPYLNPNSEDIYTPLE